MVAKVKGFRNLVMASISRNYLYSIGSVIVIIAIGTGAYLYYSADTLSKDFSLGESYLVNGDIKNAHIYFERAIEKTKPNTPQEGTLKFKVAATYGDNDYKKAIALFKEIAANDAYESETRAYAVQTMGILYYTNPNPKLITKEIFQGDPYGKFLEGKRIPLAYRRLFEYAADLYPLAVSEIQIAYWYDYVIASGIATTERIPSFVEKIKESIAASDRAIERLKGENIPSLYFYIPRTLTLKADILGHFKLRGDTSLESFGDPEAVFLEAMRADSGNRDIEAYARYRYASYLSALDPSGGKGKIIALLSPLYTKPEYSDTPTLLAIINQKNKPPTTLFRKDVMRLASIDPDFKNYLLDRVWEF